MKQQIKTTEAIFPMPVLLISTFNEDGSVDVMNAAWGTMLDRDMVALNLTETHRTVQNIKARKGFVVHIADAKHVVEADWFGVISGSKEPKKFEKSGMTFVKSELVDAPIINELPVAIECEFVEYQSDETGLGVIGKVVRTSVEEVNMKDGTMTATLKIRRFKIRERYRDEIEAFLQGNGEEIATKKDLFVPASRIVESLADKNDVVVGVDNTLK